MIRLHQVVKRYGAFEAVRGIDLEIHSGELFGLLGPNGAGKTTTMRMIAGILAPTSGRIEIAGIDVLRKPVLAKQNLGFIPDRPFVYDKLTGAEFLRFTASLYGEDGKVVEKRIDELLELFELTRWKNELTESFSHGMRQKLIIASALIHRPKVIVVDEPMVGLDPKSAKLLKQIFRHFVDKGGTVLMSTHTLEIVEEMCDRVGIIRQGELAACGTVDDLRRAASSNDAGLEELFLRLTGGHVEHDLDAVLGYLPNAPHQPSLLTLTSPKWRTVWNRVQRGGKGQLRGRTALLIVAGAVFFFFAFGISWKVVSYFKQVPEIGELLASKMLSLALMAFTAILLLSNLIGALSTFFLARDLDMLIAAPLEWGQFYLAKLAETVVHSSWMVGLLAVPLLTAYGLAWHGGLLFPLVAAAALIPLFIIPGVIGTTVTLILVNIFPARRTRDILGVVTALTAGGLVLMVRAAGPEQLARPEAFQNLLDFIAVLRAPTHPLMPSEWARAMIMNWLTRVGDPLPIALLWTTAGAFIVIAASLHRRWYIHGFTRAQEGADEFVRGTRWAGFARTLLIGMPAVRREFILKDLRIFFRDSTQWSELILLGVLVPVMLLNVQMLPLHTGEKVPVFLITIILFVTQGLAGFVIAGTAERLVFPAVSLEGRLLWLLRSSPLEAKGMLRSKYLVGILPLLVLGVALTAITNHLLHASDFMTVTSMVIVVAYTLAVTGMALGMGALFPQFDTENAAQIATSFGGLVFMLLAVALLGAVIMLEWIPVLDDARARQAGEIALSVSPEGWAALGLALCLCLVAGLLPMALARRRLDALEA